MTVEGRGKVPVPDRSDPASESVAIAQARYDDPDVVGSLHRQLGPGPFQLVCLFVSPEANFEALIADASDRFGDADVVGCTTAGELGRDGYEEDQVIALGFRADHFCILTYAIENLSEIDEQSVADRLIEQGLQASAVGEYRAFRQNQDERQLGYQRYQTVLIRPEA